jgi:CubicO group peptidase (beta-lactamase class C family)
LAAGPQRFEGGERFLYGCIEEDSMIKKALIAALVAPAALAALAAAPSVRPASSGSTVSPARAVQAVEAPATTRLKAYIDAFNSGRPERMREFFETHFAAPALQSASIADRLARYESGRLQLKSFALKRVVAERSDQSFFLVRTGGGMDALLGGVVESTAPHKLLSITLEPVENPDDIVVPDPKADEGEFAASARAYLEEQARAEEFSGVVLVARGDRVIFHEAFGFADRDKKISNRRDTKFNLGSVNKNFTRLAVHQLAAAGKLSLDDTIGKHLPDYPNAGAAQKVTIRHLLSMTSGIGDFFGPRYDATPKDKIRSLRDYLPLFADRPLEFEPGAANRYSNGGYVVLGLIIEKASGRDYYDYVRENIFKPCGMSDTDSYPRDAGVPNLALGYTRREGSRGWTLNHDTLPGRGSSAGGGYSTADDLLRYVKALRDGKVVLPDSASGLGIAGGAPGINASLDWDPRRDEVVIVLANLDPPAAGRTSRKIRSWLPR